jgi:hypothetical protein
MLSFIVLLPAGRDGVAHATGEDLTNTRWRPVGDVMVMADILFLEGKTGQPVQAAWVAEGIEPTLKYRGTYDGRTVVLNALDVNSFIGQQRTLTLTLSDDGARLIGTEREYIPDRMDETGPVEFARVGGPPPRGDEPGLPGDGGDSRGGFGGGTGPAVPVSIGSGEGPEPAAIALGAGILGTLVGLGLGGLVNSATGSPKPPRPGPAAAMPEAAQGPLPGLVPDVLGAPQAAFAPAPDAHEAVTAAPPDQAPDTDRGNRVLRVELFGRKHSSGPNRYELTARITVVVEESTGMVRCGWPTGLVETKQAGPPGGCHSFITVLEADPGQTLTVHGWIDFREPHLPASWSVPDGAGRPPVAAGVEPACPPGQPGNPENRILGVVLSGHQLPGKGPNIYELVARVQVSIEETTGRARCQWPDGLIHTRNMQSPGGVAVFTREVAAEPGSTLAVLGWVDHRDPRLPASWKVAPAPESQLVITVAKQGFLSGRATVRVAGGCNRASGTVVSRFTLRGKPESHAVADARWEASGLHADGQYRFLGRGRTDPQGRYTVPLDEILPARSAGFGEHPLVPLELGLDETVRRDLAGYQDQAERLPGGSAFMRARADCGGYAAEWYRQLCALPEAEHPKLSSALNLLRYAVAYAVMYRAGFGGHRTRVATVLRDAFGSFMDFIIEMTEIAGWLWSWTTISRAKLTQAAEKFFNIPGGSFFTKATLKIAVWGKKLVDKSTEHFITGVNKFARTLIEKGYEYGWQEPGRLPRMLMRLASQRPEMMARMGVSGPAPPSHQQGLQLVYIFFVMLGNLLSVILLMLWLAAALFWGSVVMLIIGLFWALRTARKHLPAPQAALIEIMEHQASNYAGNLYESAADFAEKIPSFWENAAAVVGLDAVLEQFIPGQAAFDRRAAGALETAYRRSSGRMVPADWTESARRVQRSERETQRQFKEEAEFEENMETASRWGKALLKLAQGLAWGFSGIVKLGARQLMLQLLALFGREAVPAALKLQHEAMQKKAQKWLDRGGSFEKFVNTVDFFIIWLPIVFREIWWLLYTDAAVQDRLRDLYTEKAARP